MSHGSGVWGAQDKGADMVSWWEASSWFIADTLFSYMVEGSRELSVLIHPHDLCTLEGPTSNIITFES